MLRELKFNVQVTFLSRSGKPATANANLWPMPLREAEKLAAVESQKPWIIQAVVKQDNTP